MTKTDKTSSSFSDLLKDYSVKLPKVGEMIKGTVISVDSGAVRLNLGITVGIVRGEELFPESSRYSRLKIGDEVEAMVVELENEQGEMELSFRAAGHQAVWSVVNKWKEDSLTVKAKVLAANKGGLMMQVDALVGFMPVSQLNPEHYPRVQGGDKTRILEKLKQMMGQDLEVKVLDADEKNNKLIVSEKAVWEDDQKSVLESYKIGDVVEGEISALTSFGAFVKFGEGLEGLVHISEIVWQRIDHPKDVLKVGDRVRAQIIDLNRSKIYLSIKRLINDPWKTVKEKYKLGQVVEGEIHKIEPFGLMVKLDDEIHGLAHVSEVSEKPVKDLSELRAIFKIGEKRNFVIMSIEPAEHRLGLKLEGIKGHDTQESPKEETETKPDEGANA